MVVLLVTRRSRARVLGKEIGRCQVFSLMVQKNIIHFLFWYGIANHLLISTGIVLLACLHFVGRMSDYIRWFVFVKDKSVMWRLIKKGAGTDNWSRWRLYNAWKKIFRHHSKQQYLEIFPDLHRLFWFRDFLRKFLGESNTFMHNYRRYKHDMRFRIKNKKACVARAWALECNPIAK